MYKSKENIEYETGDINNPLGQTHSLPSMDVRTDNMCENNDPYRPCLWVGRVDQFPRPNSVFTL